MRRLLVASGSVLAFACGGTIGPVDPGGLHIEGSYDLVVGDVQATQPSQPYPPPSGGHPAIGQHARLDILKTGSDYQAAITPDFGTTVPMSVSFEKDGTVTLSGSVSFATGDSAYVTTSDELDTIHLAVGTDGKWSGAFTAEGQEMVFQGDAGYQSDATATGTVGADARAPELRASAITSAATVVLPWDELEVDASEPLDGAAFGSAISLVPGSVHWLTPTTNVDWVGPTSIVGYRTIWDDFSGNASLGVAPGLRDPSGNASAGVSTPIAYLDVPLAPEFSGSTAPAMWGAATIASSPDSCGTAATCFEIGPLDGPCNAEPGGIAGRLPATGTTLSITYRIRVASQYGAPQWPAGLGVSFATPGVAAQLASGSAYPAFNATGDATYDYASDWTTAQIAVGPASEVGFSVVPFAAAQTYCNGELGFTPVKAVVDVVQVKLDP